ncbi:hypothetical protein KP79_PYT18990 [Mizuhopecten yessoensis]|uniref:Uncharacterized protein n=1 Tax=Mizuhopecten yessoensis TaxID=6573 RepID=A0A210Q7M7_MIZYE|nr:hypothetical protein KP79_PYT18990 [Mizuhopecten yessoensis]
MRVIMATGSVQSFLHHQLHPCDRSMLTFPNLEHRQDLATSDIQQQSQLSHIINNVLLKAMKEYGESRKFVEAKLDTYDYFFSRTVEGAEEIVLPFSPVTFEFEQR